MTGMLAKRIILTKQIFPLFTIQVTCKQHKTKHRQHWPGAIINSLYSMHESPKKAVFQDCYIVPLINDRDVAQRKIAVEDDYLRAVPEI
jgi:hypothetical protein